MRYLPISYIEENSLLAIPLYDAHGRIFLNANVPLKRFYLDKLVYLGYPGAYIYDNISKGVVVKELLSEEIRKDAIGALKTLNLDACRLLAHSIVDELIIKSDISVDMVNVASFDNYTYIHSINVAVLAVIVGMGSGLSDEQLQKISEAALLHDIGKTTIDIEVLNKKGNLSEEEMEIMRSHVIEGYKMVKDNNSISAVVKNAIYSHHENEDGTGYPQGLLGKKIHIFSKIIHVCDVYDALVTKRAYKDAINPAEALEYLMSKCWMMFDIKYVKKLMEYVSPYPTGVTVGLSNGKNAVVIAQNSENKIRPKVIVIDTREEIDLMKVLNLTITKILT